MMLEDKLGRIFGFGMYSGWSPRSIFLGTGTPWTGYIMYAPNGNF